MAFCRTCGKEVNEKAVVCIHCGCSLGNSNQAPDVDNETGATFIEGFGSFMIPLIGIILYFVKKDKQPKAAKTCLTIGLVTWVAVMIVYFYYGIY